MTNCYFQSNTHILEQSQSKMPIGNLLSDLEPEMRQRVLDEPCMLRPLILATKPYAKKIQELLMKCSYFDTVQGRFIRTKISRGREKLGPMGCITKPDKINYVQISVNGYRFKQSQLVYLWFTGKLLKTGEQIDHISGDGLDDRPQNLRVVSNALNSRNQKMRCNNTSGITGVSWYKSTGKWHAFGCEDAKTLHLGLFFTFEEAVAARKAWLDNHPELGYTARHGK